MDRHVLETQLRDALRDRDLLTHPFYRRWSEGALKTSELRSYAQQYRHFEAELPVVLSGIHHQLTNTAVRRTVARHLADEEAGEASHLELFDDFARELDATAAAPTPATSDLLATHAACVHRGPASGLGVLYAYESQAAGLAATKADGLRRWYGFEDGRGIAFWDEHARIDEHHGAWTLDGLAALAEDSRDVVLAARRGADAWWGFLDEREASRPS